MEPSLKDIFLDTYNTALQGRLTAQADKAAEQKVNYAAKLEEAKGGDVFKYLLLINVSAIEGYVAQTRSQAQVAFRLCKRVSWLSFALLFLGVGLAILNSSKGTAGSLTPAYIASLAGALSQFIAGVFFYLYNRTIAQFNLFSDKLIATQDIAVSLLANATIADETRRDASTSAYVMALVARASSRQTAQPVPRPQPPSTE